MSRDDNGQFTVLPKSSTNRKRMNHDSTGIRAGSLPNSKVWIPAKLYIDEKDLKNLWEKQNEVCYWFKIPLDSDLLFNKHPDYFPKHPLAPSVDRIDDTKDYTIDNVVICCRFANFGRNVYPFEKFHDVINLLVGRDEPIRLC